MQEVISCFVSLPISQEFGKLFGGEGVVCGSYFWIFAIFWMYQRIQQLEAAGLAIRAMDNATEFANTGYQLFNGAGLVV